MKSNFGKKENIEENYEKILQNEQIVRKFCSNYLNILKKIWEIFGQIEGIFSG